MPPYALPGRALFWLFGVSSLCVFVSGQLRAIPPLTAGPVISAAAVMDSAAHLLVLTALDHASVHPSAEPCDLYKMLHQAALGPGHHGGWTEGMEGWLRQEWADLAEPTVISAVDTAGIPVSLSTAPMMEEIGNGLVRLHMRPWRDRGGAVEPLLEAWKAGFVMQPDTLLLVRAWTELCDSLMQRGEGAEVDSFQLKLDSHAPWPAVHHSKAFRMAEDPHYRVLLRTEAIRILSQEDSSGN